MFDLRHASDEPVALHDAQPPAARPPHWLALMLDEVDYGMLLLADETTVMHANHVARTELDADHPLQLLCSTLRLRRVQDVTPLRDALSDAQRRGLRRLVSLGEGAHRMTLAVVPLARSSAPGCETHGSALTLLVFGRQRVCPALSSHWFARDHGLTPAEARVLAALCEGAAPSGIAKAQHVALSTVRTQIGSIRAKTGAVNIRALVQQVAVLPPLVGALRGLALH
jgi:DNA-binding CsgD family transcriptional regulator